MLQKVLIWSVLVFIPCTFYGQGTSCITSTQICSEVPFTYSALTGQPNSIAIECCSTTPNRAWFFFQVTTAGDIHITITPSPLKDIDFVCWGPFDSVAQGCATGLITANKIDCSYAGGTTIEVVDLPSSIVGKYYIILATNFSNQACQVTINQTSGSGSMGCLAPPSISNNGPVCSGQNLQLNASTIFGASYHWTGPNGFTSTLQNPIITNATPANSGTYSVFVTNGAITTVPVTMSVVVNQSPLATVINNTTICTGDAIQIGGGQQAGCNYTWTSVPAGFTSGLANPTANPTQTTLYNLSVQNSVGCSASSSVTISVNQVPVAVTGSFVPVCSGSAITLGTIPVAGNTYSWASNPPGFISLLANPIVNPTQNTTYTLTVTSTTSCYSIASVLITVLETPTAYTAPSQPVCLGSSVSLGTPGISGTSYSWTSTPPGYNSTMANPVVNPSATTTYTLTAQNLINGCSATNSTTITITSVPAALVAGNATICKNVSVNLGGPAVPGNSYQWVSNPPGFVSGISNPTATPLVTTTYTLTETITGTGCLATNSLTLTVNPLPQAYTGTNQSVCNGNPATIGGNSIQGSIYSWCSSPPGYSSTASNPLIYPTSTTTYTLTETIIATGCTNSNTVTVFSNPVPSCNILSNTTICAGTSVNLGGTSVSGNSYLWSSSPAGFSSANSNPSVSPSSSITYQLTETINATGCSKTKTTFITVNPIPAANTGSASSVCAGSGVTIGTAPIAGLNYSWSSNPAGFTSSSANPVVNPSSTTTYTLSVTNSSTGCSNSNSIIITIYQPPVVTLPAIPTICKNASPFQLTGGLPNGGTYSGPGIFYGMLNPGSLTQGTYTITYQYISPNGCLGSANQSITIINKAKILGHIIYDNTLNSPVDSSKVKLLNNAGNGLDSIWNDPDGSYSFQCLNAGTYQNRFNSIKSWGGVNATDALIAAQFSIGLTTLSPFRQLAGDVNMSGYINAADAYMIIKRFISSINTFPCGDWIKESNTNIAIASQNVSCNLKAICVGDVNGSYIPGLPPKSGEHNKFIPQLSLKGASAIHTNEWKTIPVFTEKSLSFSAMSLVMTFDTTQIEISNIISDLREIQFTITGNQIRIGWYSLNPVSFVSKEKIFSIICRTKSKNFTFSENAININAETEFADERAVPISGIQLNIPIQIGEKSYSNVKLNSEPLNIIESIIPNPSMGFTEVSLHFPFSGNYEILIYNQLGQIISQEQAQVNHEITIKHAFDLSSNQAGMYVLVVIFSSKDQILTENKKIFLTF